MVAIAEHPTFSMGDAVQAARDADLERAQSARERILVRGFDEEVQVRVLEREMDDSEVAAVLMGIAKRSLHRSELQLGPERRELAADPQGGMHGMTHGVRRSRTMRHA
jgi:monoamine oxidase